jgi:excisionase family DNA binding protein
MEVSMPKEKAGTAKKALMRSAAAVREPTKMKPPPSERGALTYSVPEAGRLIGLSRNGSYEAAQKGQIPTIRIGKRVIVPRAAFHAMLDSAGSEQRRQQEAATTTTQA